TTIAWRPPAFAWRTGTATADQTSSPAASSDTRRAPAPGTRRCGSTFAAVAENADFAGPNQALHLTGHAPGGNSGLGAPSRVVRQVSWSSLAAAEVDLAGQSPPPLRKAALLPCAARNW